MAISRAYLAVSTARRGGETEPLEVQVHPISRDWVAGSVSWTAGWSRPGGDFHDEIYSRATMEPSRLGEELRIDVEAMVREMRHGTACYGFVVTALPYQRLGLRTSDLLRLPGLSEPRLVVEYDPIRHVVLPGGGRSVRRESIGLPAVPRLRSRAGGPGAHRDPKGLANRCRVGRLRG
jgi:hypothetical protein